MPSPEMDAVLRNASTITTADMIRAHLHVGKEFGALRPYIDITIKKDPIGTWVISRSGHVGRAPNDAAAQSMLSMACGDALAALRDSDPARFNQAVNFINGPGLRDAEAFLASPK